MTLDDVREYESGMQEKTNEKVRESQKVRKLLFLKFCFTLHVDPYE